MQILKIKKYSKSEGKIDSARKITVAENKTLQKGQKIVKHTVLFSLEDKPKPGSVGDQEVKTSNIIPIKDDFKGGRKEISAYIGHAIGSSYEFDLFHGQEHPHTHWKGAVATKKK